MDSFLQDLRYALRRITKNPGFTIVSVLTLALGIGANSAIFSVVNGVLLKPLPFKDPASLVALYHLSEGQRATMSGPNFTDMRRLSTTLADAAAISEYRTILTGQGDPVRLNAADVSAGFFNVLGVQPALGRTFRSEENETGRTNVAILADGLWRQQFGGDPQVVGKNIILDGVSRQVVGVMPPGFAYPADRVLWTPIEHTPGFFRDRSGEIFRNNHDRRIGFHRGTSRGAPYGIEPVLVLRMKRHREVRWNRPWRRRPDEHRDRASFADRLL